MLSMGMHAQPGVYATLIGSGVSTGAGIPTGWGVVSDLIRKCAAATFPDDPLAADESAKDPESWWAAHGNGQPLGYSALLEAIAPSAAARRGILASYFEPTPDEIEEGIKTPGVAHRALAKLIKRGTIRVVITTNFDRLLERALEDEGISPQVITRPEALRGMTPLVHAQATIFKLHGDYADLEMKNTVSELSSYPSEWESLLDRVLDEYGLLISGWSAEWDSALVNALLENPSRRYPLYWDSRSGRGPAAANLLATRNGTLIPSDSADVLFKGILERVDVLDSLAESPLTSALAIGRLKRFLPQPSRRIELTDLILDEAAIVVASEAGLDIKGGTSWDVAEELFESMCLAPIPLIKLVITGIRYDNGGEHDDLWVSALQRLLSGRSERPSQYNGSLENMRFYPALLTLWASGMTAIKMRNPRLLLRLFDEPIWRDPMNQDSIVPGIKALHPWRVLDEQFMKQLPTFASSRWLYLHSHVIRRDLSFMSEFMLESATEFNIIANEFEFRLALAQYLKWGERECLPGEFLVNDWTWDTSTPSRAESDFRSEAASADDNWPWWELIGGHEQIDSKLLEFREVLKRITRN
jgi:hypothetical protein